MRKFILHIVAFSIPILFGAFILFLIPLNKNFSYHFVKGECNDKASWIYNRIFEQEDNIDIAFSGASQTSCAFMDNYIEKTLNEKGKPLKAANLGYCRRGRDIQYVMIKELFRHKKPKILMIEVAEDEPKKSHPVFPYLAENNDLWGSFVFFNQRYFINIWKGLVIRFEQLKFNVFQMKNEMTEKTASYGYLPSVQIVGTEELALNELNWRKRLNKTKPELLRQLETNYSKHYLEKTITLAKENNCRVLFVYLPETGSKLKTPLLADYYQNLGKLITLPENITGEKNNWQDAMHFNDSGAQKVSEYIADELSKTLK